MPVKAALACLMMLLTASFSRAADAPAGKPSPVLDSLTSPAAEKLFAESLGRICAHVLAQRNAQMPFASDCGPWPGMQVPAASVLGLVLLGEGNTMTKGPQAATLRKLVAYVRTAGPAAHPSIDTYRTWVLSFGLLFLSEVQRVSPAAGILKSMEEMAAKLETGHYADAGWGHTIEQDKNHYGPFVAATVWAVAGLHAARGQGVKVDAKKLEQSLAWVRKNMANDSCGCYYSTAMAGFVSPGRTSGAVWVLHRVDAEASKKQIDGGAAFISRHVALTPEGHGSGMMNFGWGALAARQVGGKLEKDFWEAHTKTIYAARREGGAFEPQAWRDLHILDQQQDRAFSKKDTAKADETAGDGWAAVWMLAAWQAARGKSVIAGKVDK